MNLDDRDFLAELLKKQQVHVNDFYTHIDLENLISFYQVLKQCQGLFIFTGLGKSALIAKKIAVTMTSTGTRSFFISPTNALHGDIGIATPQDILICISKSGETDELLHLVPFARNKHVKIAAIVCNGNSRLAKAADHVLILPNELELGPHNTIPTTSTVEQLMIGDVLAIALMQSKNFTRDDFIRNHPSGRIGKRMSVHVSDLMLKGDDLPLCDPDHQLVDVLVELSNKKCGCVLVIDKDLKLLGIFTDGDLRRTLQQYGKECFHTQMKDLMILQPRTIFREALASEALQRMEDQTNPITSLVVVDESNKVLGLIKIHDILQAGI